MGRFPVIKFNSKKFQLTLQAEPKGIRSKINKQDMMADEILLRNFGIDIL